jgi:hypothetical protein
MAQKFVHGVGPPLARIPGGYLWIIIGRAADLHKRPIAALHDRQVEPPLLLHELTQKLCAFSNYCGGGWRGLGAVFGGVALSLPRVGDQSIRCSEAGSNRCTWFGSSERCTS